jgi:hypothetical protein
VVREVFPATPKTFSSRNMISRAAFNRAADGFLGRADEFNEGG